MRALLLAAGLGTRLRPLTDSTPKCLVNIGGCPLLGIWLKQLTNAGISPFLVNTHYLADQVEAFLESSKYARDVTIVNEPILRGTAGTLIANLDFFQNDECILIHADNYSQADLLAFRKAHLNRPSYCVMTMMTFRTGSPSTCGIIVKNESNVLTEFYEKVENPPGNLANGAIYILSKECLKEVAENFQKAADFSTDIIKNFLGRIYTYETTEVFLDIGTPASYEAANRIAKIC